MMIRECDCPMTNAATNVEGVGNVVPASTAAMTGSEQCSPDAIGSGDNFGNTSKVSTQASSPRKRKKKKVLFIKRK